MHTLSLPLTPSSLRRALAAVAALAATSVAHAGGGVFVSVNVDMPGAVLRTVSAPYVVREPVYVQAPPRVVYQPAPVVYQPAPVVYRPVPVVYEAPRYWPPHHHHHHHHADRGWGGGPVMAWGGGRMWDAPRMVDHSRDGRYMVDPRQGRVTIPDGERGEWRGAQPPAGRDGDRGGDRGGRRDGHH